VRSPSSERALSPPRLHPRGSKLDQLPYRRAAQLVSLLLDSVCRSDCPSAKAPFDEIDAPPLEPRKRRAQEREQLTPLTAEPRDAQEC